MDGCQSYGHSRPAHGFVYCLLFMAAHTYARQAIIFCSVFSTAVLVGHRAKLNRTLPHVRKQAGFENDCPEFGKPSPGNDEPKNCLFSGGIMATSRLKR